LTAKAAGGNILTSFKESFDFRFARHPKTHFTSWPPMHLTKVGLTGGIATGKSTLADLWRRRGAAVIDTDELAHRALEPGTSTYQQVVDAFGTAILRPDQTIDRATLGEIVFGNERKRQALNAIVHPAVYQMWKTTVADIAGKGDVGVAVVVIPLLFEVQVEGEFDQIVTIACGTQTQRARLAAKGLSAVQADARIGAQWPLQTKMDRADFVVWNDGSQAVLRRQADIIWARIKEN
jgi:dephospho-CoA kinase